jgi:hypothetical protein
MIRSLLVFFVRMLRMVLPQRGQQSIARLRNDEPTRSRATLEPTNHSGATSASAQPLESPSVANDFFTELASPSSSPEEQKSVVDPADSETAREISSAATSSKVADVAETFPAPEVSVEDEDSEDAEHFTDGAEFDASAVDIGDKDESRRSAIDEFQIRLEEPNYDDTEDCQRSQSHDPGSHVEPPVTLLIAAPSSIAAEDIGERRSSENRDDAGTPSSESTGYLVMHATASVEVSPAAVAPDNGTSELLESAPIGDDQPSDFLSTDQRRKSIPGTSRFDARLVLRPSRRQVTTEPFIDHVAPVSDAYSIWNRAIIRSCLQHSEPGDEIFLSITPSVLAAVLNDSESTFLSADEAAAQFIGAVSDMYRSRVLSHARRLETLRRCGIDGLPECVAFLALSVLAAYRMHTDEGTAATAYYKRLDELLCSGISTTGMPVGFDGDDFHELWVFLDVWLSRDHGRRLAMPNENAGPRRFVALPLTHVPLREVDIARLPTFFEWAGYATGEHVAPDALASTLIQWVRSYGGFTRAGNEALADDRKSAVLAQVAQELASWDGSTTDAQGRRTAAVEIYLHWRRRMPILSYLPRRPAVFPTTFDDGNHVLDAGQDGWYEPAEINCDGSELRAGFSWEISAGGLTFVLRRHGSEVVAMAPSEFAGPISHGALVMGAPGAVLCADSVLTEVSPYLERITGKRCASQPAPGIRSGWTLISDVRPVRREFAPPGLESLAIESNVEIIASGGLRLGTRRAWIAGAAPRMIVSAYELRDEIRLDDELVAIDADGAIVDDGRLARAGSHVIRVGHVQYRLDIVEPEVAPVLSERSKQTDLQQQYAVALPRGSWTIIGSHHSEVARAGSDRTQRSILTTCAFRPVWAISLRAHGAVVRRLTAPVPPPASFVRRTATWAMRPWADAIYTAHVRHPEFQSDAGAGETADATWTMYTQTAKNIKRALKATCR